MRLPTRRRLVRKPTSGCVMMPPAFPAVFATPPRGGDIGPGDAHDCGTIGTLIELDHEESNGEGGHGCVRRRDPQRDEQRSNTWMRR